MKRIFFIILSFCMSRELMAFTDDVVNGMDIFDEVIINGKQTVHVGGIAYDTIIANGGIQDVSGIAYDTIINNGGIQNVLSGGSIRGTTTINAGGIQDIANANAMGSSTLGTRITLMGGTQYIRGGDVRGFITMISGTQYIMGSTWFAGMTVQNGDQIISDTASVGSITIGKGARQIIHDFASVGNNTVQNGGKMIFKSGNPTLSGSNNLIEPGGELIFETNTSVQGAFIVLEGGILSLGGSHHMMDFRNSTIRGANGIINMRLNPGESGKNSDFYFFKNIYGSFDIRFSYLNEHIDALNSLSQIAVIQNDGDGYALRRLFRDGVDVGLYNWKMWTDSNGLTSIENTWNPSTMVANTTNHAHSVQSTVRSLSNSMHKRVGELQWLEQAGTASSGERTNNSVWARMLFTNQSANNDNATGNMFGVEAGYDVKLVNTKQNKIYLGLIGHAASNNFVFNAVDSNKDKGEVSAYGAGLYAIWLGTDGWFADAAVRQHFISQDATMYAMGITGTTTFDTTHMASSVNIDIGRQFGQESWFLTPHVQFNAAYILGSDFTMSNGMTGQIEDMMNANIGAMIMGGPRWKMKDGADLQLYVKGGYIADFSDNPSTSVMGMNLQREFGVGNYEIGGGLNYRSRDKRISTHIDIQQRFGDGFSELSGIVGLRYGF